MKVSDYIVEFLIEQGITDLFGYPGGMVAHLMDSFSKYENKIKAHINYQEQASSFAACGYAQVSGMTGVAYSSSGPGATNLITGICNAYFDSISTVFITGQVNTFEARGNLSVRQKGFQETEIVPMVKTVTKYAVCVRNPKEIKYELRKAFYLASEGRPGPVLIDIPMDVQRSEINPHELKDYAIKDSLKVSFDNIYSLIQEALELSQRPCILAGAGIKNEILSKQKFRSLVRNLNIPVVTSMLAVDVLPENNECNYGFIGAYGNRHSNFILSKADLLITIGSRLDVRQIGASAKGFAEKAKLIRIDIDEGELANKIKEDEIGICIDIEEFLDGCLDNITFHYESKEWKGICDRLKKDLVGIDNKLPNKFVYEISKLIRDNSIITTDVGQNQVWVAQSFAFKENQTVLFSGGLGSMGYSLPAAIGAYYGRQNGEHIVSINGDGGIQMNIQELQFIAREKIPMLIIIINNRALGMIRHFQEMYFNSNYTQTISGMGYEAPDFDKIAKAYELEFHRITALDEIKENLFCVVKPTILEVVMFENTYVYPKLEFGKPNQDQEPLLDRKLYEQLQRM